MKSLAALIMLMSQSLGAAVINIDAGFPFNPRSVTVTAGDTIHWQFLSGHNVAETNDPLPGAATYNGTGFQSPCCSASTFDWVSTVGNHVYFCQAHGGFSMYGHIHVLPPPTPTSSATPSITLTSSDTRTATETHTPSPTATETLTITETHTITPTFTESQTFTPGPSLTFSSTASHSPSPTNSPSPSPTPTATWTATATPTVSPTPSFSPTPSPSPSQSATSTPTPKFDRSPNDRVILGPVPVKAGNPLCLAFPSAPFRTLCELYNSRGELVVREKFEAQARQCLSTQNLAPGLYFANIEEDDSAGNHKERLQKIVILP